MESAYRAPTLCLLSALTKGTMPDLRPPKRGDQGLDAAGDSGAGRSDSPGVALASSVIGEVGVHGSSVRARWSSTVRPASPTAASCLAPEYNTSIAQPTSSR